MIAIDQAQFNFSPTIGMAVAVMVGFLVFAVALDLTWDQFQRVARNPKAPLIGLAAQFLVLPAVAFSIGLMLADTPSIALGMLLVTCCPAGALSNYLTGVARGSVATSISMTAISTLFSIVATPVLFAFWATMNPDTRAVLRQIEIDAAQVVLVIFIMLVAPVTAGMLIRAKRPVTADRIRVWSRRIAGAVFAVVVAILLLGNIKVLGTFARTALPPVFLTFIVAVALGWSLARVAGLAAADRRAVTLEVAFQNVALAIGLAVTFFPALAGVAITAILWGVVHLTFGFALAATWMRMPIANSASAALIERDIGGRLKSAAMDAQKFKQVSHNIWEAMAPGWDARHGYFEKIAQPVTERMLRRLDPSPGDEILELAAGTGIVGFSVAKLIGPRGRVMASDFSEAMVEAAARRAGELGLDNVECRVLDAEMLDLPDACVDGVVCRWGYMLMADPAAALRETRRVLRKSGRIACAVFAGPEQNPWAAIPARILIEGGFMPPPEPGSPGILALADRDRLHELFTSAGFSEPAIEGVDFVVQAKDFDDYWDLVSRATGAIAMVLERLEPEDRERVRAAIADSIRPFLRDGQIAIPAQALVVSAS